MKKVHFDTANPPKKRTKYLLAALLLIIVIAGAVAWFRASQTNKYTSCEDFVRTDLPGFCAVTKEMDENATVHTGNLCQQEMPVTFVDEIGRAWKLSASGWNFLWTGTDAVGATIDAHNIKTGEVFTFHIGHPEHSNNLYPIAVQDDLTIDPLPVVKEFLNWNWLEPCYNKNDFKNFAEKQLQAEEIDPSEVGQKVAFGNELTVEQTAAFNTQMLIAPSEDTPTKTSNESIQTILLADLPEIGNPDQIFTAVYTNKNGLIWTLQWLTNNETSMDFEGFMMYASCGYSGTVRIVLSSDYLSTHGISDIDSALKNIHQTLDLFSPYEA